MILFNQSTNPSLNLYIPLFLLFLSILLRRIFLIDILVSRMAFSNNFLHSTFIFSPIGTPLNIKQVSSLKNPLYASCSEDKSLITVEELKDYLGIGTTNAYEICNMKDFPCVKLGRRRVIPKKELREWLAKQAQEEKHYVRVIGR